MSFKRWALSAIATCLIATQLGLHPASAATDFYAYGGSTPLAQIAPGTVLKTRTVSYPLAGLPLPLTVVQLLFRSTDAQGRPNTAVTSVIQPLGLPQNRILSYQSFYDSLSATDGPSYGFAGGVATSGGASLGAEVALTVPFLLQGYAVNFPDTEGQKADFAAGPEYGRITLDSLRAASSSPATGVTKAASIGLYGYSGGAIATMWASTLAPSYAPDIQSRLVGSAAGGILVAPANNLHYIDGSVVWAGVEAMAVIGVARSYDIDFTPYLNDYGKAILAKMEHDQIFRVLGEYPGLTWAQMTLPQYQVPESVPAFVRTVNKLNLGSEAAPKIPMFMGQGAGGTAEGTAGNKPGIGPGDGVMIAGDVRSLARQYCAAGTQVQYEQYDATSHVGTVPLWAPQATTWLLDRFAGKAATNDCASIAPGNSLAPAVIVPPTAGPSPASTPSGTPSSNPVSGLAGPLSQPVTPGFRIDSVVGSLLGLL